jgi:aldehyde dehydrogenase (NAD+)
MGKRSDVDVASRLHGDGDRAGEEDEAMTVWRGQFTQLFIGGAWADPQSARRHDVISPATEEVVATIPLASRADIDDAVAAARAAFDHGPWSNTTLEERIAVLTRLLELIRDRADDFAELVTAEIGMPISVSRSAQVGVGALLLETAIATAKRYPWQEVRRSPIASALVSREPVGVVAAIVPWNGPFSVAMLKIPPALLAGCTVVYKPSPESALDSYLLMELMEEAGVPPGVINHVPADRDESAHLVAHPGVDKVSFTGSTAAGAAIGAQCGRDFRRVTLELGGKSAAIMLDDADLESFVASTKALSFGYSGQRCNNKTRILVPRARETEVVEALVAMASSLRVGDPFDPETEVGPMITSAHRDRVEGYIRAGVKEGARIAAGGGRPDGIECGWYVEPTVFADATNDMKISREEIFGPVVSVIAYDSTQQAIELANDSPYGLSGTVYSADPRRAFEVARRLRTGTVEINGATAGFDAPLGGFKSSGIGREAAAEGFDGFVELKSYGLPGTLADQLS